MSKYVLYGITSVDGGKVLAKALIDEEKEELILVPFENGSTKIIRGKRTILSEIINEMVGRKNSWCKYRVSPSQIYYSEDRWRKIRVFPVLEIDKLDDSEITIVGHVKIITTFDRDTKTTKDIASVEIYFGEDPEYTLNIEYDIPHLVKELVCQMTEMACQLNGPKNVDVVKY